MQQFASLEGMRLHDLEFFRREPARFVEHRVGDGDLADIMHGGGTDHLVDGAVRKVVFRISERQGFQQKPGDFADPPDMRPGFAAPELNDGAQGIDNEFVETVKLQRLLFKGFHLLPDERLKMALVQVEFDGVVDAALDDIRLPDRQRTRDRFRHIIPAFLLRDTVCQPVIHQFHHRILFFCY